MNVSISHARSSSMLTVLTGLTTHAITQRELTSMLCEFAYILTSQASQYYDSVRSWRPRLQASHL